MNVDDQIRDGWRSYYTAIGSGHSDEAKRIFDRVAALAFAQTARKTTARMLAPVLEAK